MTSMENLQDKINQYALIVRKYNLGNKDYFNFYFSNLANSKLEMAWTFAQSKIQNEEIIKNASRLTVEEEKLATLKTSAFDNKSSKLYERLNSKFDVKDLKLKDENVERKVRHVLALRFLKNLSNEIKEFENVEPKFFKPKIVRFINKIKYGLIAVAIILVFFAPRIIDGLTLPENLLNKYLHNKYSLIKASVIDVNVITNYLYENSKYKFNGAICNDGSTSHSQGQGTCSYHDGVDYYFYVGDYSKTIEECRENAIKTIDEMRKKALDKSWRD